MSEKWKKCLNISVCKSYGFTFEREINEYIDYFNDCSDEKYCYCKVYEYLGDIEQAVTIRNRLAHGQWKIQLNSNESNLIIYIPENMLTIDETKIETGAGKINIGSLNTQSLYLELGAGDVYIENVIANQETKIDGGVGKTELKSCEINNLKANLGMGEFVFSGKLTNKTEINSGVGGISINLMDDKENYTIKVSKGLGRVTLAGQKLETDRVYGTGKNYLDIDGGIGEIKINFEEK